MTAITIEHVSDQELPEAWRGQLHQRSGRFYRVTIEEETPPSEQAELSKWGKAAEKLKSNARLEGCSDQVAELTEGFRESLSM